jgi:polyisoprenoid-binding protein YceI
MLNRLLAVTVAAALAGGAAAAFAQAAQIVPARSEIVFTTKQMGVPVEGRFGRYSASIEFDPKRPEGGSVAFTIDTASARFGSAELDGEVGKPVWLNVPKFPRASFQSAGIKAAGSGRFEVAGRLTIKGATQDVVVPVQLQQTGSAVTASGSFTIKRLAFKVGDGEWSDTSLLANDVNVRFKFALSGLAPP